MKGARGSGVLGGAANAAVEPVAPLPLLLPGNEHPGRKSGRPAFCNLFCASMLVRVANGERRTNADTYEDHYCGRGPMWYVLMGIGSSDCDEPPRDSRGGSSRDRPSSAPPSSASRCGRWSGEACSRPETPSPATQGAGSRSRPVTLSELSDSARPRRGRRAGSRGRQRASERASSDRHRCSESPTGL